MKKLTNKSLNQMVKLCSIVLLSAASLTHAKPIDLTTEQGFVIKADYFASKTKTNKAVLMLHQCNFNRSMYEQIGKSFAKRGINALSIDFRGFGESVNEEFNVTKLQELPREQRRPAWRKMSANWGDDVQLAYNYLNSKLSEKAQIGVIGASCGGSQAIGLAEKSPISMISFFSSAQRDENIERYKKVLADKPTLIIAAEDDGNTFTSAQSLFKTAKHGQSQLVSYKGGDHGYPLLDKDSDLANKIVTWFARQF